MTKKRKLNSKNPKYKKDKGKELVIIKTVELIGKAKGRGVWYKW
jgi:hypothetical protein|tara:strand:- start:371 stop:502 length:132 start_codon:yes stop_codon:yes gene_type:complete